MSSVLDAAILVGVESTYGTPAALTRAFEGKADAWKRSQEYLESVGFRGGMHTARSDRRKAVLMGAEGSLEVDFLTKGMGLLLSGLLGTVPTPTLVGTTAYTQTHATSTDGPSRSYTFQVLRPTSAGALQAFTYHGAVPTGWTLTQEVGSNLALSVDFDAEDEDTVTAAGTPTYPATASPFDWTQAVVSLNSTPTDFSKFEVTADLGMKTDRRFLRGSPLKKKPIRTSVPTFEGSLEGEFEGTSIHALFAAGTIASLSAVWTGSLIEASHPFQVTVTLPAVQFTGESPEASLEDVTVQPAPFRVLHDGTNPAITILVKSTDAAL